jgi:hypothetical protein
MILESGASAALRGGVNGLTGSKGNAAACSLAGSGRLRIFEIRLPGTIADVVCLDDCPTGTCQIENRQTYFNHILNSRSAKNRYGV